MSSCQAGACQIRNLVSMLFSAIPAATCRVRSEYLPFLTLYTKCGQTEAGSDRNSFFWPMKSAQVEGGFLTCHKLFIRWRENEWHWLSSFRKTVTLSSISLLVKCKTPFPHREVIQALPETPRKNSLKTWIGFILFLVRINTWWGQFPVGPSGVMVVPGLSPWFPCLYTVT